MVNVLSSNISCKNNSFAINFISNWGFNSFIALAIWLSSTKIRHSLQLTVLRRNKSFITHYASLAVNYPPSTTSQKTINIPDSLTTLVEMKRQAGHQERSNYTVLSLVIWWMQNSHPHPSSQWPISRLLKAAVFPVFKFLLDKAIRYGKQLFTILVLSESKFIPYALWI